MLRTTFSRLPKILACAAGTALIAAATGASAAYPERPVTLVVPFPPGGNSDIVGRLVADGMGKTLGQTVIVENRAGAGGLIGNQTVARAPSDGHTILLGGMSTQILLPGTSAQMPYDPVEAFSSVGLISKVPLVLVVPATSPAKDLREFVDYLKNSPGAYNYSSAGIGTSGHITAQYFADSVGAEVVHVPYKGSSPALIDLVEGRNAYLVDTPPVIKELVKAGKIRALVVFSDERLSDLPDVPTVAEAGLDDVIKEKLAPWQGLFVPAGTPPEVEARIHEALNDALADSALQQKLTELGLIPMAGSLDDAKALFKEDYAKWITILDDMGLSESR